MSTLTTGAVTNLAGSLISVYESDMDDGGCLGTAMGALDIFTEARLGPDEKLQKPLAA